MAIVSAIRDAACPVCGKRYTSLDWVEIENALGDHLAKWHPAFDPTVVPSRRSAS